MDGRFTILGIPGSGAHATVCIVRDGEAGEVRALKVLGEDYEPESMEARRVRDEGRILQRLSHPGLPRVHEQLEIAGRQVLVMDFVDGPSLAWWMRSEKRLPPGIAFAIARQVAEVVDHAYVGDPGHTGHPAKLIHRDLNPTNILLDRSGRVKVLDFGLARAEFVDRESFTAVSLLGTPGYTAPEGLRAIPDNPRLDVYSLGICLIAMLGGHVPMLSRDPVRHRTQLERSLARVEELSGVVGARLDLVRRCCSHDPAGRPGMSEVVEAIPDGSADLETYVKERVLPAHRARRQVDPLVHGAYGELAFIEGILVGDGDGTPPERADRVVRRFLARPRWEARISDLKWVLVRYPAWTSAPFLERLEPVLTPWWRRRGHLPSARVVATSLAACSHRTGPDVQQAAEQLVKSRNATVASIAARILEGEEVPLESLEQISWMK